MTLTISLVLFPRNLLFRYLACFPISNCLNPFLLIMRSHTFQKFMITILDFYLDFYHRQFGLSNQPSILQSQTIWIVKSTIYLAITDNLDCQINHLSCNHRQFGLSNQPFLFHQYPYLSYIVVLLNAMTM